MRTLHSLFLIILLTAGLCSAAYAQVAPSATSVTQSAFRADGATFLQQSAGGSAACNTVNSTTANDTITITPPAGYFVVLTGLYIESLPNATGVTAFNNFVSTNLTGNPVWSIATFTNAATVPGAYTSVNETYPTGLKSTVAGTAVTIAQSAQNAQTAFCMHAAGYFSPQ